MFLNIGSNFNIFYEDIIAVIDIENMKAGANEEFIENMRKNKNCVILGRKSRSLIVADKKGETKVYLSPVSVKTIKKRLTFITAYLKRDIRARNYKK